MAKPPVCKIMDYGKFKYEAKKKASEAKKKQTVVKLKEVKFRPKTEEHDYAFKTRAIREFLAEGNKARVTVMFRGREITHREIGQNILRRIETELKDIAVVEQPSRLEGRLLFMILAPNPRYLQQQRAAQQQQPQAAGAPAAQRPGQPTAPRPGAPQARPPSAGPRPATVTNGSPRPAAASSSPAPTQRAEAPKA
jgi:translation initiation factor IF-3